MTLSARQRLIAIVAALNLVLVVAGWALLISPQRHDASTASAQAQLAQTQAAALKSGGKQTSNGTPAIQTSCIYKLETALPAEQDQPDLLFQWDRLAAGQNLRVTGLSVLVGQAMPAGYTIQPITLKLVGKYSQLAGFLHQLRMLVSAQHGCPNAKGQLFAVTTVALTVDSEHPQLEDATIGVEAFYYGTTAGATPPPAPASTSTDSTTTTSTTGS